uniref:Uncharacterized protein n=1 Tax=Ciona intestinalis TaxID=7719 RepID=H2XXU8_CIOIN
MTLGKYFKGWCANNFATALHKVPWHQRQHCGTRDNTAAPDTTPWHRNLNPLTSTNQYHPSNNMNRTETHSKEIYQQVLISFELLLFVNHLVLVHHHFVLEDGKFYELCCYLVRKY